MKHKQLLERELGREISERSWYRLNRKLKDIGVRKEEYPEILKVVAVMNRSSRISLNRHFLMVWNSIRSLEVNKPNAQMSCEEFRKMLSEKMNYFPQDRFKKDGSFIGISTMWYRWFKAGSINYKAEQLHPIRAYIGVACAVITWHENQQSKHQQTPDTKKTNLLGAINNV